MLNPLAELDAILRAQRSAPHLGSPAPAISNARLLLYCVALGAIYGLFMGLYSVSMHGGDGLLQVAASTAKLPLLFLLTLCITFPSMYVFSALGGSRLDLRRTLSLLLHSLAITLALAASFAPILGFFTLSTRSYHFMVLLNVGFLGCAGIVGCACLSRSLTRLLTQPSGGESARSTVDSARVAEFAGQADGASGVETDPRALMQQRYAATLSRPPSQRTDPASFIIQVWIVLYGVVGAQMGWVLRPFIGSPDQPFTVFRERSGNVLQAVGGALMKLLGVETGR